MLKIKPIEDKEEQKKLSEICGIIFEEDFFAYSAYDEGRFIGMSQFNIASGEGYIKDLVLAPGIDDWEALFIMGRATMNFIDLCGVHICRAPADGDAIFKQIGFIESDGTLLCDMRGMFDSKCSGDGAGKNAK